MPQPDDVTAVGEQLIDTYRQAEQQLLDRLAAVIDDPSRWRETARLRDLLAGVDAILDELERASLGWANASLPTVYEAGAQAAASTLGSSFAWSTPHTEAMQALATATWDDILQATTFVRADTKATLRRLVRDGTLRSLTGQVTPDASARDLARQLVDEQGLLTVRYSNGARHSVADWADTAIRTRTASTYNEGGFVQTEEDGFTHLMCFDGADCGLRRHDDPDKANGTVRSIDVARQYPLGHPRCSRSWSPMPSVSTDAEAEAASTPAEARAIAAAEEALRAQQQPVRLSVAAQGRRGARRARPTRQRPTRTR